MNRNNWLHLKTFDVFFCSYPCPKDPLPKPQLFPRAKPMPKLWNPWCWRSDGFSLIQLKVPWFRTFICIENHQSAQREKKTDSRGHKQTSISFKNLYIFLVTQETFWRHVTFLFSRFLLFHFWYSNDPILTQSWSIHS